jgi:hydroxyacylglutathione hydrolase
MNTITVYTLRVQKLWFINYCYLVVNNTDNSGLLVDPAWELDTIVQKTASMEIDLHGILLTHSHSDHINLADTLATKYQIPAYMSRDEIEYYNFKCHNLNSIDTFKQFELGKIVINPMLTPGHTYGGTSFLIENNLFCGDTLFIEGCGVCHTKGGNPEVMFNTLQHLKKTILPQTLVYPGHCYGTPVGQTFEYVLANNIYLQFDNKENFISYRMRENQRNLFKFM